MSAVGLPWSSELSLRSGGADNRSTKDHWFLNLAAVTSVTSPDLIKHAAKIFDIFMVNSLSSGIQAKCNTAETEKGWGKLVYTMNDILAMVYINLIERLIFLFDCCVCGFIDAASSCQNPSSTALFSSQETICDVFRYIIYTLSFYWEY